MEERSDRQLIELTLAGRKEAFEEIIDRYSNRVFQVASRFFRERDRVEEAAQQVFVRLYRQLAKYRGEGSFEGWLTRLATNVCLNLIRHNKKRPEEALSTLVPEGWVEEEWLSNLMVREASNPGSDSEKRLVAADLAEKLLQFLEPEERLVLILLDGEGAPVKEVAEQLQWSASRVKVRAFRARRKLRQRMQQLLKSKKVKS